MEQKSSVSGAVSPLIFSLYLLYNHRSDYYHQILHSTETLIKHRHDLPTKLSAVGREDPPPAGK